MPTIRIRVSDLQLQETLKQVDEQQLVGEETQTPSQASSSSSLRRSQRKRKTRSESLDEPMMDIVKLQPVIDIVKLEPGMREAVSEDDIRLAMQMLKIVQVANPDRGRKCAKTLTQEDVVNRSMIAVASSKSLDGVVKTSDSFYFVYFDDSGLCMCAAEVRIHERLSFAEIICMSIYFPKDGISCLNDLIDLLRIELRERKLSYIYCVPQVFFTPNLTNIGFSQLLPAPLKFFTSVVQPKIPRSGPSMVLCLAGSTSAESTDEFLLPSYVEIFIYSKENLEISQTPNYTSLPLSNDLMDAFGFSADTSLSNLFLNNPSFGNRQVSEIWRRAQVKRKIDGFLLLEYHNQQKSVYLEWVHEHSLRIRPETHQMVKPAKSEKIPAAYFRQPPLVWRNVTGAWEFEEEISILPISDSSTIISQWRNNQFQGFSSEGEDIHALGIFSRSESMGVIVYRSFPVLASVQLLSVEIRPTLRGRGLGTYALNQAESIWAKEGYVNALWSWAGGKALIWLSARGWMKGLPFPRSVFKGVGGDDIEATEDKKLEEEKEVEEVDSLNPLFVENSGFLKKKICEPKWFQRPLLNPQPFECEAPTNATYVEISLGPSTWRKAKVMLKYENEHSFIQVEYGYSPKWFTEWVPAESERLRACQSGRRITERISKDLSNRACRQLAREGQIPKNLNLPVLPNLDISKIIENSEKITFPQNDQDRQEAALVLEHSLACVGGRHINHCLFTKDPHARFDCSVLSLEFSHHTEFSTNDFSLNPLSVGVAAVGSAVEAGNSHGVPGSTSPAVSSSIGPWLGVSNNLAAPSEKRVVAVVVYKVHPRESFAELAFFATRHEFRGRGYGKKLLDELSNTWKEQNLGYCLTFADLSAVSFFEKCGFSDKIPFPKSLWEGRIDTYSGARLMALSMNGRDEQATASQVDKTLDATASVESSREQSESEGEECDEEEISSNQDLRDDSKMRIFLGDRKSGGIWRDVKVEYENSFYFQVSYDYRGKSWVEKIGRESSRLRWVRKRENLETLPKIIQSEGAERRSKRVSKLSASIS